MLLKEILEEEISKLKDGHPKLLRNLKAEVRALEDAGGADAALQPGDLAPEFKLQDQNDRTIDSKRILKRHPLIVVFYHGDWSSLCMLTLKSMQDHVSSFEQKDAQIVAICPQSNTQAAAEKSGAHFSLLADPGNKVAKKFRLVYMMDTELPGSSSPWPLPMAATYILDTDGIVTYASVSCNPLLRAEPLDILGVIPRPIRLSNRAIPAIPRPVRHTSRNLSIDQGCHNYDLPDLPAKKELFCQIVFPLVRDRTYRCKTYPKIFVGAEAIDALVYADFAKTRREAVFFGRMVAKEFSIFQHVLNEHSFCDDYLFYQFNDSAPAPPCLKPLIGPLGEKADQFESIVNIQDRMHRLKKFKKCFVGREAVDAMIHCGLSESRQQAVDLGRTLERELRLFKHVSKGHKFKDEYLFYRIVPRVATDSITSVKDTLHISSDGSGLSTSDEEEGVDGHASTHKVSSEILTGNVEKMVEMFRQCVDVRDRQDHFKKYKHCFVGCDAVDALVECGMARNRKDAVELGQNLAKEQQLFQHVTGDQDFCDDYVFFRFSDLPNDPQGEAAILEEHEEEKNNEIPFFLE